MNVVGCVVEQHGIGLILVAGLICVTGCWTVLRLFNRSANATGLQRIGWHFLASVAAGASIWCTHFVAMLAYDPGVPVGFDPVLTIVSLLTAIAGTMIGLTIAGHGGKRRSAMVGGAIFGLAIVTMHYTGMLAYRVQGIVAWDRTYLIASIVLSVVFSALAFHVAARSVRPSDKYTATGLLVLAILSLHFTGMTAFQVSPMLIDGAWSNPDALLGLALAVAGAAAIIVGAALACYLIDGSVQAESYERLRHMALNDSLTGLPNRASFNDRLDREIDLAAGTDGKLALIGIDLDRFKEINDFHGHAAGDEVLRVLATRIGNLLEAGEFVARLGGDEFVALHRVRDRAGLVDFTARLEAALSRPIRLDACEVIPGASLGVAIYPDNAASTDALTSCADLALYRAKADFTRTVCFYEQEMDETVRARRNLAAELRDALENGQLDIHYQVQTSVATGEIRGYEALLRWRHPRRGFVPPSEFIPLAEESGLILQLGEWVLRETCARAATWEQPYKVAVNLSPVQLAHIDLPKLILAILFETDLSPDRLELELTESTLFADRERSLLVLQKIKMLGVSIALDDFGTGYSSLDTLRAFPFDKIKLDRSFMSEVETSPQAKAIIRAVLALGKSLDIPILAEGIETRGQLSLLDAEGCDEAQGYLLGRPVPLDEIVTSGQISIAGAPQAMPAAHAPILHPRWAVPGSRVA